MRLFPCCLIVALSLVLPAAVASPSTNDAGRIELRWQNRLVRVAPGADEPAESGSFDVRLYDVHGPGARVFLDGVVCPREGSLTQAWFTDLDGDGVAEIVVWTTGSDACGTGHLNLLTLNGDDGGLDEVPIPEPAHSWLRGYQGQDTYRVEQGALCRTFPVYRSKDAPKHPTGGERTLKLINERDRWMWRLESVK